MHISKTSLIILSTFIICSCDDTSRKSSLDYDVENLSAKVESLEIQIDSIKYLLDDIQSKTDDTSNSSTDEFGNVSSMESRLVAKLKGFDFTRGDIKKLKELVKDKKYSKLVSSAEACLFIINCGKNRTDQDYIEHNLLHRLLPCHLKLKSAICHGRRLNNSFLCTQRRNFETVNEFFSYLEERINP